ncbi:hypothetical protein [Aquimarina rhabdastrellae]
MKKNIETLKTYFETGDQPTQNQYENVMDSFVSKKDGGTFNAQIAIDRDLSQAQSWSSYDERNLNSGCLALGRIIDTYENGFQQRLLHFFDFPAMDVLNEKDSVFLGIEDQNNKGRFRFYAEKDGQSFLSLNDKNQTEFFKAGQVSEDQFYVQLVKPNSRVVIGSHAAYKPEAKLVVKSGNAIVEGTVEAEEGNFNTVKLTNSGYTGITDGATTPVPSQGAGTMIFDNGSFYGFNGNQWKKIG